MAITRYYTQDSTTGELDSMVVSGGFVMSNAITATLDGGG